MKRKEGASASVHLIGNAHLDPVWLWPWQEGFSEIKATFRSALDRLKEYPAFMFTCACASYYKWVEENEPAMFKEIAERVAEGRWIITGGWWIQPDCNLPSGESFARHGLYGQRYFREKFGVMAKVGYNVDSFGHHAMLPQILKLSGMDYYLFMRPEAHEKELSSDLFWWESADGSRVMTFRLADSYGNHYRDGLKGKVLKHKGLAEEKGHPYMTFYGVGNHGGGPTIANIELLEELRQEQGEGTILFSSPNHYFAEMERQSPSVPVIRDEMQRHAVGCYSAHSESKAYNRLAEHRLLSAEKFSSLAHLAHGLPYPGAALLQAWDNVMFNQFHDVMGGCSIREAFEDARQMYGESLTIGARALNAAVQKLSWSIDTMKPEVKSLSKEKDWMTWEQGDLGIPFVVFNPLSWEVEAPVVMNRVVSGLQDDQGIAMQLQTVRSSRTNGSEDKWDTLFLARIPALGYRVYWAYRDKVLRPEDGDRVMPGYERRGNGNMTMQESLEHGDGNKTENGGHRGGGGKSPSEAHVLENKWLRVELQPHTGYIARILDKDSGRELFRGKGAVPIVIDEHHADTWGHGLERFRDEIGRFADAELRVVEDGPICRTIRVTSRYNRSLLRQDFSLYAHAKELRVKVQLDWREQHKMLKLSFPVNVERPEHTAEIPYGFIQRAADGVEVPGQQWIDVSGEAPGKEGERLGMALLNDSKYSYDVQDNEMRLTAVRSPIFADHYGERDDQVEFMDQGVQEFAYALLPHGGDWREYGIARRAYQLNVPPVSVWETYHSGSLLQCGEGLSVTSPQVIVTAFKRAEDGGGWIVRGYETTGRKTIARIRIPLLKREWECSFGACEIKTFYLPEDGSTPVREVNMLELALEEKKEE
ncbi:alpha-mannosidase [Paenibacillus chungangensis]|uniref:Alpha-mannosidase n=1 Tax=Paenibacillus chungangensis TaxID=696535 RepID=A0ABW3HTS3_9BACL